MLTLLVLLGIGAIGGGTAGGIAWHRRAARKALPSGTEPIKKTFATTPFERRMEAEGITVIGWVKKGHDNYRREVYHEGVEVDFDYLIRRSLPALLGTLYTFPAGARCSYCRGRIYFVLRVVTMRPPKSAIDVAVHETEYLFHACTRCGVFTNSLGHPNKDDGGPVEGCESFFEWLKMREHRRQPADEGRIRALQEELARCKMRADQLRGEIAAERARLPGEPYRDRLPEASAIPELPTSTEPEAA